MLDFTGLKEYIFKVCALPSISGFEARAENALRDLVPDGIEFIGCDGVGNMLFCKRCGHEGAPKILIDTHFDEIGLIVREVLDGGFLRVAPLGGIDPAIMQASDVYIYGKRTLRGVVVSTPPHLKKSGDLPEVKDMLIDTCLDKAEAEELIPIGTPIGFAPVYGELLNGRIVGKSFDDKACGACALWALSRTPRDKLAGDIYLLFSAIEETSRLGGAAVASFSLLPDRAMVVDVNLARVPDTKDFETVKMGEGVSVSISAATDLRLSKGVIHLCREKSIPHTVIAAPSSTGTNAPSVNLAAFGVPVVDVGLPLASMHTYCETVALSDCESLCRLISEFVCAEF